MSLYIKDKYNLSKREQSFLLRKNLVELVYNAGKFEGLNTTLLQTEEIIKHNRALNVNADDVVTILNLKKGYQIIETEETVSLLDFSKKANEIIAREDALIPGEFRTGGVTVSTMEGTYVPHRLTADQIESEFNDILAQEESKTKKGLSLFLFMTKNQIFWDGNKRTAVVTVNKYFYENGLGIFTIPHKEFIEFNELLSRYYHSNVQNNDDAILTFMYERCIFGIDYI